MLNYRRELSKTRCFLCILSSVWGSTDGSRSSPLLAVSFLGL